MARDKFMADGEIAQQPDPVSPKAKTGDVVTYWEDPSATARHAVVLSVSVDNSASLKVIMPATRKGGGGVIKRDGVAFAEEPTKGCWGRAGQ